MIAPATPMLLVMFVMMLLAILSAVKKDPRIIFKIGQENLLRIATTAIIFSIAVFLFSI